MFLFEPFLEFEFMQRALIGLAILCLGACPLGVFLMLRRMSLMGDAISHAILPGAALGYVVFGLSLSAMTLGGFFAGLIVALLAGIIARSSVLKEDVALASFYLLALALGVILVSLRGSNIDLLHVLFGSVLALDDHAVMLIAGIASLTLLYLAFSFRLLVLECFDPISLRGFRAYSLFAHFSFLIFVVLNLVAGFHTLGTLLAVGIMMLPAASARLWSEEITGLTFLSFVIGLVSSFVGLLLSFYMNLPAGPSVILAAGIIYFMSLLFGVRGGYLWQLLPRRHLEA